MSTVTTAPSAAVQASAPTETVAKPAKPPANPKALKTPRTAKPAKKTAAKKGATTEPAAVTRSVKSTVASTTSKTSETKVKKPKLVRDSFTIPKDEYVVLDSLKLRAAALSHPVKKSELLRAGLKVLAGLSDSALRNALQSVPSIKTGRPKAEAAVTASTAAAKTREKTSRK